MAPSILSYDTAVRLWTGLWRVFFLSWYTFFISEQLPLKPCVWWRICGSTPPIYSAFFRPLYNINIMIYSHLYTIFVINNLDV